MMAYPPFPADPSGGTVPVLPVKYATVLEAALPQAAVAFGPGGGMMVRVWTIGCDMYYAWGAGGVATAPSASYGGFVKDGNFFDVPVPDGLTHFRAVARSGSGSFRLELLGA